MKQEIAYALAAVVVAFLCLSAGYLSGHFLYIAEMKTDCNLLGLHRIGEEVFICKNAKAAE